VILPRTLVPPEETRSGGPPSQRQSPTVGGRRQEATMTSTTGVGPKVLALQWARRTTLMEHRRGSRRDGCRECRGEPDGHRRGRPASAGPDRPAAAGHPLQHPDAPLCRYRRRRGATSARQVGTGLSTGGLAGRVMVVERTREATGTTWVVTSERLAMLSEVLRVRVSGDSVFRQRGDRSAGVSSLGLLGTSLNRNCPVSHPLAALLGIPGQPCSLRARLQDIVRRSSLTYTGERRASRRRDW